MKNGFVRAFMVFLATSVVGGAFVGGWQSSNPDGASHGSAIIGLLLGFVAAVADWWFMRGGGDRLSPEREANGVNSDRIARMAIRAQRNNTTAHNQTVGGRNSELPTAAARQISQFSVISDEHGSVEIDMAHTDEIARVQVSREITAAIEAARTKPIVFRESYPPPAAPGLSFYGGTPIGPVGMIWPRGLADHRPLTFLMQWEAATLAAQDTTGLMPRDGVLYLFSCLLWGEEMEFRFIHEGGQTDGWTLLPVPDDLPVAWGEEAAHASPFVSPHVPADQQQAPRLLPCWPFTPMAIDYPGHDEDGSDGDGPRFWRDGSAVKEVLIRAQDPEARLVPGPVSSKAAFARPFPSFPQDWAAVRVVAAAALKKRIESWQWKRFAPDADEAARATMTATWRNEALALYEEAITHPLGQAIPWELSDALWERMQGLELVLWPFEGTVEDSVNVSLGLSSEAIASIPAALIEAGARRHSLGYAWQREEYQHEFVKRMGLGDALEQARATWRQSRTDEDMKRIQSVEKELSSAYEGAKASGELTQVRDIWAPTPNRMLGAPSYVQGYVEEYVEDRLLLLELTSSESIGLGLGEGVLQFMIRPDDLSARRFDRVQVVCSAY